jgi:hypothetical protein
MIYHIRDEHANYYATYMVLHIEITIISSKYFCIRFFDSFVGFVAYMWTVAFQWASIITIQLGVLD